MDRKKTNFAKRSQKTLILIRDREIKKTKIDQSIAGKKCKFCQQIKEKHVNFVK